MVHHCSFTDIFNSLPYILSLDRFIINPQEKDISTIRHRWPGYLLHFNKRNIYVCPALRFLDGWYFCNNKFWIGFKQNFIFLKEGKFFNRFSWEWFSNLNQACFSKRFCHLLVNGTGKKLLVNNSFIFLIFWRIFDPSPYCFICNWLDVL